MICGFCKQDKPASDFGPEPNPRYSKLGWWCRACGANRSMIRNHGITNQDKARIAQFQCGCAICGHIDPGTHGWNVDHDRTCCEGSKSCPKCRRGILCGWCNKLLGLAFDRPQILKSAIEYLERHAPGTCDWHRPLACTPRMCGNEALGTMHGPTDQDGLTQNLTQLGDKSYVGQRARTAARFDLAVMAQ